MAHGSLRQMRRYAHKVFEKDARLGRMSDGRRDPTLPLEAVLATWQWGLIRQTPSTEQIGELLRDRRWRARLGLQPEAGGSADRAAEVLAGLASEEWQEMMLQDFFRARRAGVLSGEGQYGKRRAPDLRARTDARYPPSANPTSSKRRCTVKTRSPGFPCDR